MMSLPRFRDCSSWPLRRPSPAAVMSTMDTIPHAIPNIVRNVRSLCAHKVRKTSPMRSRRTILHLDAARHGRLAERVSLVFHTEGMSSLFAYSQDRRRRTINRKARQGLVKDTKIVCMNIQIYNFHLLRRRKAHSSGSDKNLNRHTLGTNRWLFTRGADRSICAHLGNHRNRP